MTRKKPNYHLFIALMQTLAILFIAFLIAYINASKYYEKPIPVKETKHELLTPEQQQLRDQLITPNLPR